MTEAEWWVCSIVERDLQVFPDKAEGLPGPGGRSVDQKILIVQFAIIKAGKALIHEFKFFHSCSFRTIVKMPPLLIIRGKSCVGHHIPK